MTYEYANQSVPDTLVDRIRCQNGSERLDLSLCNMTRVPLQPIKDNFDGTPLQLDLSFNKIRFIGPKFTLDMIHLTRLDLSRNEIKQLPDNFGMMQQLVYLDLHKNQLQTLPVSMGKMSRLQFLCMSENPFRPPLSDFLGQHEPKISAVALAQLVVQFLEEFATVHTPDTRSQKSISRESKRSRKVHYREQSRFTEIEGNASSASSVASGGKSLSTTVQTNVSKQQQGIPLSVLLFRIVSIIAIWFILLSVLVAYLVDTSYLEHLAEKYAGFGYFWHWYKYAHNKALWITSGLPNVSKYRIQPPPPPSVWAKLGNLLVDVKNAYVNAIWGVASWFRSLLPF